MAATTIEKLLDERGVFGTSLYTRVMYVLSHTETYDKAYIDSVRVTALASYGKFTAKQKKSFVNVKVPASRYDDQWENIVYSEDENSD